MDKQALMKERQNFIKLQEKERTRITRDLHDGPMQNLTHIIHKLEIASKYMDKDTISAKLELQTISKSIKNIIEEMYAIIYDLKPMSLDDIGFISTMKDFFSNLQPKTDMKIFFDIPDSIENISNEYLLEAFRIIREGCNNAIKHSNGNKLDVTLKVKGNLLIIRIFDNGTSFDEEKIKKETNHFGLAILKEEITLLSGKMEIIKESQGLELYFTIPIMKRSSI